VAAVITLIGSAAKGQPLPERTRAYWIDKVPISVRHERVDEPEGSSTLTTAPNKRPLQRGLLFGGEGGIRTLDTGLSPYNALAGRHLRPLGHLSAADRSCELLNLPFSDPCHPWPQVAPGTSRYLSCARGAYGTRSHDQLYQYRQTSLLAASPVAAGGANRQQLYIDAPEAHMSTRLPPPGRTSYECYGERNLSRAREGYHLIPPLSAMLSSHPPVFAIICPLQMRP
jgi:hypothetical protein